MLRPVTQQVECMFDKHKVKGSNPFRSSFALIFIVVVHPRGGMVDALDSKSSTLLCVGSSPVADIYCLIKLKQFCEANSWYIFYCLLIKIKYP